MEKNQKISSASTPTQSPQNQMIYDELVEIKDILRGMKSHYDKGEKTSEKGKLIMDKLGKAMDMLDNKDIPNYEDRIRRATTLLSASLLEKNYKKLTRFELISNTFSEGVKDIEKIRARMDDKIAGKYLEERNKTHPQPHR